MGIADRVKKNTGFKLGMAELAICQALEEEIDARVLAAVAKERIAYSRIDARDQE